MSSIEQLAKSHFSSLGAGVDARIDIAELDIGLFHAGKVAEVIYDQCIGQTDDVDPDSIAASAKALLALLGHLGTLVDALSEIASSSLSKAPATASEIK